MPDHEVFDMSFRTAGPKTFNDAKSVLSTVQELFQHRSFAWILTQQNMGHAFPTNIGFGTDEIEVTRFLGTLLHDLDYPALRSNRIQKFRSSTLDAIQLAGTPKHCTVWPSRRPRLPRCSNYTYSSRHPCAKRSGVHRSRNAVFGGSLHPDRHGGQLAGLIPRKPSCKTRHDRRSGRSQCGCAEGSGHHSGTAQGHAGADGTADGTFDRPLNQSPAVAAPVYLRAGSEQVAPAGGLCSGCDGGASEDGRRSTGVDERADAGANERCASSGGPGTVPIPAI